MLHEHVWKNRAAISDLPKSTILFISMVAMRGELGIEILTADCEHCTYRDAGNVNLACLKIQIIGTFHLLPFVISIFSNLS